jgi:hypothetical protein
MESMLSKVILTAYRGTLGDDVVPCGFTNTYMYTTVAWDLDTVGHKEARHKWEQRKGRQHLFFCLF